MTTDVGVFGIPEFNRADRLRKAREYAGLDQNELAERVGVSRNTISNAERGANSPRLIVIRAWALATGVPVQWIETGTAPSPGGDGASGLPQLDLNQQPFGLRAQQVTSELQPRPLRKVA